jgi:tRNA (guanine-N7-)-methyltransferase
MARRIRDYPSVALRKESLGLKPEDVDGKIDFVQIFGRSGPVHIEIGTGKAAFLLNQAKAQPDVNFLGIERANKYYRYAVDRIGRWAVRNVRIIRTDAAALLADLIPDNSVDCFHIYFPDPWPKRRHHKRRLLCAANLEHLIRCLKTAGTLRIATDNADYFQEIEKLVAAESDRLEEIQFIPAAGAKEDELTGTNYERKYIKDKKEIYTLAVRKR